MEEQKPFHFYLLPECAVDNTSNDSISVAELNTIEPTTIELTISESISPLIEHTVVDQIETLNIEPILAEQPSEPIVGEQLSEPIVSEPPSEPIVSEPPSEPIAADEIKTPVSIEYFDCEYDKETNLLIYPCPHCKLSTTTLVSELACCIFRHGMNKQNQQQVSPHESKERCDAFANNPDYVGCCKPYRIDNINGSYKVSVCDYI